MSSLISSAFEEGERDGFGHGFIAGGRGVEVVSTVVGRAKVIGLTRIADNAVEIENAIEVPLTANPLIDRLAVGFTQRTIPPAYF